MSSENKRNDNPSKGQSTEFSSPLMCIDLTTDDASAHLKRLKDGANSQVEPFPADFVDNATIDSCERQNSPSGTKT